MSIIKSINFYSDLSIILFPVLSVDALNFVLARNHVVRCTSHSSATTKLYESIAGIHRLYDGAALYTAPSIAKCENTSLELSCELHALRLLFADSFCRYN